MHCLFFHEALLNVSLSFQMICSVICECLAPEIPSCVRVSAAGSTCAHLPRLGAACLGCLWQCWAVQRSLATTLEHLQEAARVTDGDRKYKGASSPSLAGQG